MWRALFDDVLAGSFIAASSRPDLQRLISPGYAARYFPDSLPIASVAQRPCCVRLQNPGQRNCTSLSCGDPGQSMVAVKLRPVD